MKSYIERNLYHSIKAHMSKKQVTVITGLRRTGKTTLLRKALEDIKTKNKLYIDLERLDNRDLFTEKNYDNILISLAYRGIDIKKKAVIGIDEIQLVPEIISVIKYFYDHYGFKFIVTGSSSYYIKNLFTESLAGRKKVFELSTLSFSEFQRFKGLNNIPKELFKNFFIRNEYERLKKLYEEFINYGGFPEVALTSSARVKRDFLNDIVDSYLRIDIRSIVDIRDQKNIYRLMKMLASRTATRLDYSKLSVLTGISRSSVYDYLSLLENTFIITRITVESRNPDKEIVKAPKLYFNDNGLVNMLAQVSSGVLFENAIFNQLKHHGSLKYYSLKSGREIDFIFNGKTAIEVKETASGQDLLSLRRLSKNLNIKKNILISRYPSPKFNNFVWGGDID